MSGAEMTFPVGAGMGVAGGGALLICISDAVSNFDAASAPVFDDAILKENGG